MIGIDSTENKAFIKYIINMGGKWDRGRSIMPLIHAKLQLASSTAAGSSSFRLFVVVGTSILLVLLILVYKIFSSKHFGGAQFWKDLVSLLPIGGASV